MNPWIISFDAKFFLSKNWGLTIVKVPSRAPRPSPLIPLLWRLGATGKVVEGMDAKWKILDRQWCPWGVCCALSREVHGSKTDGVCRASSCGGKGTCWGLATLLTCDPWHKDVMFDHHTILTSFADRIVVIYNCNARNTWMKHHKTLLKVKWLSFWAWGQGEFSMEFKEYAEMPQQRAEDHFFVGQLKSQSQTELKLWMVRLIQMIHASKILE